MIGVVTKWRPGRAPEDFFSDDDFQRCFDAVLQDLKKVEEILAYGGEVVFTTAPSAPGSPSCQRVRRVSMRP